jgi:putative MFS transporter
MSQRPPRSTESGVAFSNPVAFWAGVALIIAGVVMHLIEFLGSRDMHYRMSGMPMTPEMIGAMAAIVLGLLLTFYGVFPRRALAGGAVPLGSNVYLTTLDEGRLSPAHWRLVAVLSLALVIDVMKPATLGFVVPGLRAEYGLTASQAALLPFVALTGTAVGSLLWGWLADRLGRRTMILLATLLFVATSICGAMPSFEWNLVMCSLMGMSAGGLLPIVYALMGESIPAASRGWLMVLQAGVGVVGGYLAASGAAALLIPLFGWRILWLLGLPTGIAMILLNRAIPESPRFLAGRGLIDEANAVMRRYGARVTLQPQAAPAGAESPALVPAGLRGLRRPFQPPYLPQTLVVLVCGLGWGLVNYGFLTFLPTILQNAGYDGRTYRGLLATSALIAAPSIPLAAWLYGKWSGRRTMILYALVTAGTLMGFVLLPLGPGSHGIVLITALMVVLLSASAGLSAVLSPYTAEVFPTWLRGVGCGLAAGSGKLGGMMAPLIFAIVLSEGLALPALVVAAPVFVAGVALWRVGIETRGRPLEEIVA